MRLTDLLHDEIDSLSQRQFQRLKHKFPSVVTYRNGEPQFIGKPTTRDEALEWLRGFRIIRKYEKKIENPPKRLILFSKGEETPPIDEFLMKRFNISEADIA